MEEMEVNRNDNTPSEADPLPPPQAPPGTGLPEILPEATLADLPEKLRQGAALAGWSELMPVQSKAIPYLFAQRDMMIQSRTGSGKTGAYLLPVLEMVNPRERTTQALVLVPTRELALQVYTESELLGRPTGVRSAAVYGGVGYREQLEAFKAGAHLVVGTPGRVLDHLLRRSMTLENLKFIIFDEADRMLSMGFYPDMRRIQAYLPNRRVSTYMFSATFPPQVIRLADGFMHSPGFLNLSSDHIHVTETEHLYYSVPAMDKDRSLVRIIEVENPINGLIFCNTKQRVDYVTVVLQRFGYDADELTSDLSQAAREKVLERVRRGELRFLVATDVAARGIDLPELSHVIQYEPPEDAEAYIHRAGRTGRAGGSGTAISLVSAGERARLVSIAKRFKIDLQERPLPSDDAVEQVVAERVITLLEARLRGRDRLQAERMERFFPLARRLCCSTAESAPRNGAQREEDLGAESLPGNGAEAGAEAVVEAVAEAGSMNAEMPSSAVPGDAGEAIGQAEALLAMLLDDFYQETFHAPVVPPVTGEEAITRRPSGGASGRGGRSRRPRGKRGGS